jgi:hypothetical protein
MDDTNIEESLQLQLSELILRSQSLSRLLSLRLNYSSLGELVRKNRLTVDQVNKIRKLYAITEEIFPGRVDIQFDTKVEYDIVENMYGYNCLGIISNLVRRRIDSLNEEEREAEITHLNRQVNRVIVFKYLKIDKCYIVIHFPDVTVKNEKKDSINIKDLFVRLPFRFHGSDRAEFKRIEGTRTTFSITEFVANYLHSHLPARMLRDHINRITYNRFCTGEGDIVSSMALVNDVESEFDEDTFRLYLLQIEPYIQWESIEGGPHIKMEEVHKKGDTIDTLSQGQLDEAFIIINCENTRMAERHNIYPDIDWKVVNGEFKIIDNDKFDIYLNSMVRTVSNRYFVKKTNRGEYYKTGTRLSFREIDIVAKPNDWIPFKGEKIFFNVTMSELERQSIPNDVLYIHPQIKDYVRTRFEQKANNSKIREVAIRRANTPNNF